MLIGGVEFGGVKFAGANIIKKMYLARAKYISFTFLVHIFEKLWNFYKNLYFNLLTITKLKINNLE